MSSPNVKQSTTVIYVRGATHRGPTVHNLAGQEHVCRAYAAARGWRVGEVFAEAGVTGSSAYRPGLSRLFAAVRDGTVERVLVTTPDRLSRSRRGLATLHPRHDSCRVASCSPERSGTATWG